MIKKHKRSFDEDENDYESIDGAVKSSEESENFDDDYEDGNSDGYDVDYKKGQTKKNKKTRKELSNYLK